MVDEFDTEGPGASPEFDTYAQKWRDARKFDTGGPGPGRNLTRPQSGPKFDTGGGAGRGPKFDTEWGAPGPAKI